MAKEDIKLYTLQSSEMCHTPGIIAWAINGAAFEDDRPAMVDFICNTYQGVSRNAAHKLLTKQVPYTVEGDNVVFEA